MGIYNPVNPYQFVKPQSPNPRLRRPEDATLARYGDLRYLLQNGLISAVDVTSSELYELSVNKKMIPGSKYRITDYKSVNFRNGFQNANNNVAPVTGQRYFTINTTIETNFGTGYSPIPFTPINCVAVNDTISNGFYIYGNFSNFNGVGSPRLQKLTSTGLPDPSFNYYNPGATNPGFYSPLNTATIQDVVVQSDGKLIVVGEFTSLNDIPCNHIVRLNPNGTIDTTFGTGTNGPLGRVKLFSDGKILITGSFNVFNGNPVPLGICRLNPNGSLDTLFNSNLGLGLGTNFFPVDYSSRMNILISQYGKIYLYGFISGGWNGNATVGNIVKLNADGTTDTTFQNSNVASGFQTSFVRFLHELENGDLLVSLSTWFAIPTTSSLQRLSSNGTFISYFGNITNEVRAAKTLADKSIIFVGSTINANQFYSYNNIINLDQTGSLNYKYRYTGSSLNSFDLTVTNNEAIAFVSTNGLPLNLIPINLTNNPGPYDPFDVHISDPEVLIVTALNEYECEPVGYSETYGDMVSYLPYLKEIGIIQNLGNGLRSYNDNVNPITGFDLQWDISRGVAYFTMPVNNPVSFGNFLYISIDFDLGNYYVDCPIEMISPGVNWNTFDYYVSSNVIATSVIVSPDGYTVTLPEITYAQYLTYVVDSLYVEVTAPTAPANGFITWRYNTKVNVQATFDWRNYNFRRYEVDTSLIDPTYTELEYCATKDVYEGITPVPITGNYQDFPPLYTGKEYYNNNTSYSYQVYTNAISVNISTSPGYTANYYYGGTVDNFVGIYMEGVFVEPSTILLDSTFINVERMSLNQAVVYSSFFPNVVFSSFTVSSLSASFFINISNSVINGLNSSLCYWPVINNLYTSGINASSATSFTSNLLLGDNTNGQSKLMLTATDGTVQILTHDGTNFVSTPL